MECVCGFVAKSAAGLSSHQRARRCGRESGSLSAAMETTLGELDRLGRFEAVDAARVQALRQMALALDANPHNSGLWRELRESLSGVMEADDDADDALAAALAQIAGAASLGDSAAS